MTRGTFEEANHAEPAVASSRPPRRSGLLPILLGGVSLLIVVVLGAVVVQGWGGQQIAQPDPSATPAPSASAESPSGAPSLTTQVVSPSASATPSSRPIEVVLDASEPGTTQTVTGLAEGPLGGVATVTVYPFGEIPPVGGGENPDGAIYLESPDGTWSLLDTGATFEGVFLASVKAAADGSLVAYGGIAVSSADSRETTGLWVSSDGRAWTEVAEAPPLAAPLGHVRAHFDLAARAITVFASADAVTWELVFSRPAQNAVVRDVGTGPEGFVIVAEDSERHVPIVLASADGREWFEAPSQDSLPPDSTLIAVEPIGPDWLVAGWEPGGTTGIATWWSANGLEWEKAATITSDAPWFGFPAGLHSTADRLVLSASKAVEGALPRFIASWTSADGITWGQVPLGPEAGVEAVMDRGDRILLGGRMGETDGRAMIWSWDPESGIQAGATP